MSSPPAHPLSSSRAKIKRAKEHLAALIRDSAVWMVSEWETEQAHFMSIRKERDAEPGKVHFVAEAVPTTDLFRWGLYLGDLVQNVRSALDHLAFALAEKDAPARGEDRVTQFVIVRDSTEFQKVGWHLDHLSTAHKDMIEKEQPYHPNPDPATVAVHTLTMLERLSNIDKHRIIHVVQFGADLHSYSNPSPFVLTNAQITSHVIHEHPLEEGAKLMTVTLSKLDPDGPEPEVDMQPVLFSPTLALGPGQLIKHIGPNLINYVSALVERFAAEF